VIVPSRGVSPHWSTVNMTHIADDFGDEEAEEGAGASGKRLGWLRALLGYTDERGDGDAYNDWQ